MGACVSLANSEDARSRELDVIVSDSKRHVLRLLLLGAGESGKSTISKQFRLLYGKGFSESDRASYRPIIAANVIASMKRLLQQCAESGVSLGELQVGRGARC